MTPLSVAAKAARILAIRRALRVAEGNVSQASRMLGYAGPGSLFRQLRRYGITAAEFRAAVEEGT